MPLLKVNASATGLRLHESSTQAEYLIRDLSHCRGPVIIMVHGYKYAPGSRRHCPHRKLFNETNTGWPAGFGYGAGDPNEGLGICFGWYARGALHKVHHRAKTLGVDLARIVTLVRASSPGKSVHVVAHSLGAEVALSALEHLIEGSISRMILLTGAAYQQRAATMLRTPAGKTTEVLNVTSRENDLFDAAFECLAAPAQSNRLAIGQGIAAPKAVNLQIDCASTIEALRDLALPIAPADRLICHWSSYRRAGVMTLYNRFLRCPDRMSLSLLRSVVPTDTEPRWSRLLFRRAAQYAPSRLTATNQRLLELSCTLRQKGQVRRGRRENEHAY